MSILDPLGTDAPDRSSFHPLGWMGIVVKRWTRRPQRHPRIDDLSPHLRQDIGLDRSRR